MKHLCILSLFLIALIAAGCSGGTATTDIDSADEAIRTGDMARARELADKLLADSASLTVDELGRLSLLYMVLADRTDDPSVVDQAIDCYRLAFSRDTQGAINFYRSLSVDDERYVMLLSNISRSLETPAITSDTIGESFADTLSLTTPSL